MFLNEKKEKKMEIVLEVNEDKKNRDPFMRIKTNYVGMKGKRGS